MDLTVDGESRRVWTTARTCRRGPDDVRRSCPRARPSPHPGRHASRRAGIDLDIRLPHDLTFLADGKRSELTTNAATVREALAQAGITLRPQDRLNAGLTDVPADEQVLAVTRVDRKIVTQEIADPVQDHQRRRRRTSTRVETRIVEEGQGRRPGGRPGSETFIDGKLSDRRTLSDRIAVKPVTQVLLVGTKARPQNSPSADGLNWAALARCESGGNPKAYNPAGPYYGLYQFLASTWHSVGGTGVPTDHAAAEQTYRAQILYKRSGRGQWPVCGRYL